MIGTYRIYKDGEIVAEKTNLITDSGKRAILRYLAGHSTDFIKCIAVGTSNVAATTADTKLSFEVVRVPLTVISPDYVTQKLIFKGTVPQNEQFAIWEVGSLSEAATDGRGRLLLSFNSDMEAWTGGTYQTDANRIGGDTFRVNAALSATTTGTLATTFIDVGEFADTDKFTLAYAPVDANLASAKIRLKTDASNYWEYSLVGLTAGYKVESWTKAQMTKTGAPAWNNITSVDIVVTAKAAGATNVDFDGLRIDLVTGLGLDAPLVSRTVLGAAVLKSAESEMDVEYELDVTI